MKRRSLTPCAALLTLLAACAASPSPAPPVPHATPAPSASVAVPSTPTPTPSTAPTPSTPRPPSVLEQGDHVFAARLYVSQAAAAPGNLALSPASARVALGMAYLGARGDTAKEMASALGLPTDVAQASTDLSDAVKTWNDTRDPKVKLALANGLFGQKGWPFEAPYTTTLKDSFGAPLSIVDFRHDMTGAKDTINRFVASHTDNLIPSLLKEGDVTSRTRFALVNATYFKGEWKTEFPASASAPGPFHVAADHDVTTTLMHMHSTDSPYGETADAHVIGLPYGAGAYAMVLVLPKAATGFPALEHGMTGAGMDAWFNSLHGENDVEVTLPRFEVETRVSLVTALAGMGMSRAFDEYLADFSGIAKPATSDDNLSLEKVIQLAKVKVDEKGTVAVAATYVGGVVPTAYHVPQKFTADRPFLYFIRDARGNVLFMGRVVQP